MKKILFLFTVYFASCLNAVILLSPMEIMKQNYPASSRIDKRDITLSNTEAKKISQQAKVKIKSKKFQLYTAVNNGQTIGYGILINRKVRSKNAVILYLISNDSVLKSIEVIAFNEPMEYIPSKEWLKQFENAKVKKEVANITGATLSANSIIESSKLAFAFYKEIIKGKK